MPYKHPEDRRARRKVYLKEQRLLHPEKMRERDRVNSLRWRREHPTPGITPRMQGRRSHTTHGLRSTNIYKVWLGMRERCFNLHHVSYARYGGRGITVCQRWDEFLNFYSDMAPTYQEGLTLDRMNNDGDYTPDNCRWVTRLIQANNMASSRLITYQEETHSEAEWARLLNLKRSTFQSRLNRGIARGIDIYDVMTAMQHS